MLGLLLLIYRATDWCRDPHRRQGSDGLGLPELVPGGPTARMQPGVAGAFGAKRQRWVVGVLGLAAAVTAPCRRPHRIAVLPFNDTAGEGVGLGLLSRQTTVKLGDAQSI